MTNEEYDAKFKSRIDDAIEDKYTLACDNASAAVYLYIALCLQPQGYGDRIDKSERGYLLWLYAGLSTVSPHMINILNIALEDKNISIRARREIIVEAPALGRRQFVGNRFVLRLERPGIEDFIDNDVIHTFNEGRYTAMAKYMPKLAQRHMSYADVDSAYDIIFKPVFLIKGEVAGFMCSITQNGKVIAQLTNPTRPV
jgi:hypothetical protein